MNVDGEKERFAELWRALPFDAQVQIDMAIGHSDKLEAMDLCRTLGKGFDLDLARRRSPGKS